MDWCVNDFQRANHAPTAIVRGDSSRDVLRISGLSADTLDLSAAGSTDPDGDELEFRWWSYREPGTSQGEIELRHPNTAECSIALPDVIQPKTIHLILEVTDTGEPSLTCFRRIVVEVLPAR